MSITVEHLTYTYSKGMPNETLALDNVSFSLADGEFAAIIGHTGSGKSTLLQQLNGLLHPDSGRITVDNVCITDDGVKMVDIRRRVGLVFQYPEYQLFEENVAKDVAFGPKQIGISGDELDHAVREAIALTGLDYDKVAECSPFELSGGQKRRVAIAGVLAMKPEVLILDEPTAGLDPVAHREVLNLIRNIHQQSGMTILLVSHNMGDIAELADRVLVMDDGHLVMNGTPSEVFSQGEKLRAIGLNVPPAMEMMEKLHERIPEIEANALTIPAAVEAIANYLQQKHAPAGVIEQA
jgi:energy-coupling factor transport system ATP-binding protein